MNARRGAAAGMAFVDNQLVCVAVTYCVLLASAKATMDGDSAVCTLQRAVFKVVEIQEARLRAGLPVEAWSVGPPASRNGVYRSAGPVVCPEDSFWPLRAADLL